MFKKLLYDMQVFSSTKHFGKIKKIHFFEIQRFEIGFPNLYLSGNL